MGALDDARSHLAKAREFLEAAEVTLDLGLCNAAASSASHADRAPQSQRRRLNTVYRVTEVVTIRANARG